MKLSKVNHIITTILGMLETLRGEGVINYDQVNLLLPRLVLHAIRNDNIDTD